MIMVCVKLPVIKFANYWNPSYVCVGEVYKLEVKDPPQGVTPPTQTEKKPHQPNKVQCQLHS